MKTALYRHFDKHGALLYVGISGSVLQRTTQHLKGSRWADLIHRIDVEHYDTREEALNAEAKAIQKERPAFNEAGHRRPKGWALLDINEGWADGWYFDYQDVVQMVGFYRLAFPEAAVIVVPQGSALGAFCRGRITGGHRFYDHLEYFKRWQRVESCA